MNNMILKQFFVFFRRKLIQIQLGNIIGIVVGQHGVLIGGFIAPTYFSLATIRLLRSQPTPPASAASTIATIVVVVASSNNDSKGDTHNISTPPIPTKVGFVGPVPPPASI